MNKDRRANIRLLLFSTVATLAVLELFFRYVFIQTNGMDVTLSNQKWLERYWNPVNTLGLRDVEYTEEYRKGKKLVFVVGDSFAAGLGIKKIGQRFGSLLGAKLGSSYAMINLAERGWSTADELQALSEFPFKPDIVVLWYFVNDIEGAAARLNIFSPTNDEVYAINDNTDLFHSIRKHSFFVDFVYWRLYFLSARNEDRWWQWVRGLYDDPQIWDVHQRELDSLIAYSRYYKAALYVVIIPNLMDIPGSIDSTGKVERFFAERGIRTLNLSGPFLPVPKAKLIVNTTDGHPSEFVHAFAADKLFPMIREDAGAMPGPH